MLHLNMNKLGMEDLRRALRGFSLFIKTISNGSSSDVYDYGLTTKPASAIKSCDMEFQTKPKADLAKSSLKIDVRG
jgi:hypothetical protein